MELHSEILTEFFENHYPNLKDIEIQKLELWASTDMVFHRPTDADVVDESDMEDEADGMRLTFKSKKTLPIADLVNLCNIICYGIAWSVHPDYGDCPLSEFDTCLNGELDTCWHHTQITKLTDSYCSFYTIEQGFCHCS
jgi:hypothetical protein